MTGWTTNCLGEPMMRYDYVMRTSGKKKCMGGDKGTEIRGFPGTGESTARSAIAWDGAGTGTLRKDAERMRKNRLKKQ